MFGVVCLEIRDAKLKPVDSGRHCSLENPQRRIGAFLDDVGAMVYKDRELPTIRNTALNVLV